MDSQLTTALLTVDRPAEAVARCTMRRPEQRNALSVALRDDMSRALEALAYDEGVSVIVITGEGAVFSAGFDLGEFDRAGEDPDFSRALWASSDRWHAALRTFPLPLIAALNGPALAGGFDLATMCDLRVAVDTAYLARPEVEWTTPIYSIVRDLVGGAIARELAFTNRRLTAGEAHDLGLLNRVVPGGELEQTSVELARQIATAPRDALRVTKASAIAAAKIPTDAELGW